MTIRQTGVPRVGASLKAENVQEEGAPERKSFGEGRPLTGDVRDAMDEFMSAFDAFKDANDERLGQIERKLSADVVTEEKVERINRALDRQKKTVDDLALALARPELGAERGDPVRREHKDAWSLYVRKGEMHGLRQIEAKALSVQSDPDGGYLVPSDTERLIDRIVTQASPIRSIAGVRQISGASYKKPFTTSGLSSGWVGETESRAETQTPQLSELEFPAMELYAMPSATSTLLDDAAINIDQWLAEEVQTVFAEQEGAAFVNGDGVRKPRGFLSYPVVADASWSWGNVGYITTGVSGDFSSTSPSDALIDLTFAIKAGYRANASFVLNRRTQARIRKLKDQEGNYLWQPGLTAGTPASLLNFPVTEAEDMPDVAANSFSIAFGDFKRGYLIVDRLGVRVLRDPYSAKPYVLFYTTKRVGGGIQNFEALKLLKFGTA